MLLGTGFLAAIGVAPGQTTAASANLVVNPGFEDDGGAWTGWTYDGTEGALTIKTDTASSGNIRSGSRSASYWSASDYHFTLSQTITGLEDGDYVLTAWSSGDANNKDIRLFADGFGGSKLETPIVNTGWGSISSYTVENIHVSNGQATIGFEVDSYGGKWGFFDDVDFRKVDSAPTWGSDKTLTGEAGPSSVLLRWSGVNDPAGVTAYRIYQDGELLDTTTDTQYEAIDLQPSTTHTFAVQAGNAAGEWSTDGPTADIATADATASAPSWSADKTLTVSGVTAHGALLSWSGATDEAGVTQYRVYVNGKAKAQLSALSATYALTDLTPSASYTVRVEAGNAASLWSADGPTATFETPSAVGGEFIKGADISTLQAIEDAGGKYYDGGQQQDLLAILKAHGVNYIRLRLWNDPVQADGYNDKAHVLAMAKRVKEAGLKLLLDFHYSDFWADPGQQAKPAAWASLGYDDLKSAVYGYTSDVMNALAAEDAYPDMVQIGNEINSGMLLPDGSTANYDRLAGLLSSGIQAVRDTTPAGHDVKIMLHLAEGGNNAAFRAFFDAMKQRNVDYDVIGMSYYPYWHGSLQQLKTNLNDMAARYGKQVVVAETSYGYTTADGDGWPDSFGQAEADEGGFPATVEGQKQFVTTVLNTVAHVPDGLGLGAFYWEPAWIPVPKDADGNYRAGWKSKEGNAWDNQAMFDFQGNALPSLDAFRFEPGDLPDALPLSVKQPEGVTVPAGMSAEEAAAMLPAAVDVLYNEGSIVQAPVDWEAIDPEALTRVGTFELTGTVQGTGETTRIAVTVSAYRNVLVNPGFETDYDMTGWTLTGTAGAALVKDDSANAYSGARAVNYYSASDFHFTLAQTVKGLPNGTYTLKARISGGGGDRSVQLFAGGYGGEPLTSDNIVNTGWQKWNEATIASIQVTNGEATIGLSVDAPAGTWGWIDDFELYRNTEVPEWGEGAALMVSDVGTNSLKLDWSGVKAPSGLAGYKIYENGRKLATVTEPGYTVTGLAPNTTYTFKVEASCDGLIWTSTGPGASATTQAEAQSPPPPSSGGDPSTPPSSPSDGDSNTPPPSSSDGDPSTPPSLSGGGTPTASGDSLTPGTIQLKDADLTDGDNGELTARLPEGATVVSLPARIAERLNGRALELRTEGLSLRIPASLLTALEERAGAADARVTLQIRPVTGSEADSLGARLTKETGANVRIVGGAYEFSLSAVTADGKPAASLTEFAEPIVVRFKAPAEGEADTTGIFYVPDGGKPVYVGGTLRGGYYEASVRHFSRYALLDVDRTFADVAPQHWAYGAIRKLAARQYVDGVGGGRFDPSGQVTRAEFAAMLARASGLSGSNAASGAQATGAAASGTPAFTDVPGDAWYASDVAAAAAAGLIQGRGAGEFDPNGTITREEMAAMAVRAAALLTGRQAPAAATAGDHAPAADRYADVASIAPWARSYVAAAAAWQLAQGRGGGRFEPQGAVTRAEAAQIAANVIALGEAEPAGQG